MRVCLVYDCLFPHTVGGAERWYRSLAERLAREGHEVTYLTMRQWDRGVEPELPGVRVRAVAPRMALYTRGRRRIAPPVLFGVGVFAHLLRHGRKYDVVHTCAFPYFSLLAAASARRVGRYRLVVDWFEVWSDEYWRGYLGGFRGRVGSRVQRRCARVRQRAFCFSRLHAGRLSSLGGPSEPQILTGLFDPPPDLPKPRSVAEPIVVFAGRHIPEKRVPALVDAIVLARRERPDLRAEIYGDGPDHDEVARRIAAAGLSESVTLGGFVGAPKIAAAIASASCLVLPSEREGYGLVVVEASALGTPSVLVPGDDNAATELVDDGENGVVAAGSSPAELARAITRVIASGPEMRSSTRAWYSRNQQRLALDGSLAKVAAAYGELPSP